MKICSVEGCGRKHDAKGLCHLHYNRWKRHGDPTHEPTSRANGLGTLADQYVRYVINGKRIREHQIIAEKVLGRPLPKGAQVHHVDGNKLNNAGNNLVICPNDAYHKLLHLRTRALDECGNANYLMCRKCKAWGDPETMRYYAANRSFFHLSCKRVAA